mgnify:CR=1 FL=1|jgi:hypothetical protein
MDQNLENKIELRDKLISLYNKNKIKIFLFVSLLIILISSVIFIEINNKKKNDLIAEKYVKAGLLLSTGKKNKSRELYEEIIFSKNNFYSILALNAILEKKLDTDSTKILNYFETIIKLDNTQEQKDLAILKKALFLIKTSKQQEGKKILKNLASKNAKLKPLIDEIITE